MLRPRRRDVVGRVGGELCRRNRESNSTSAPPIVKYEGYVGVFDTPEAACQNWVAHQFDTISTTDLVYDHVGPSPSTRYPPENFVSCFSRSPSGAIGWLAVMSIRRSCDGISWVGYAITCTRNVCPANSTLASGTATVTTCTCNTGYQPDPTATSCVPVVACPVAKLTAPPFNDACAQALENISSTQAQKDAACGSLTPAMQAGKSCLEGKLSSMSPAISLAITADIRDIAYQAHFREIWDKMEKLVRLMKEDPAMQTACAVRRAEIAAEKGCNNAGPCTSCTSPIATQRNHCLKGRPAKPSPNDAQHIQGNAIDVSETRTMDPLLAALGARRPPQTIPQFLDASPTNCNLNWGGTFKDNYDPVHFYAR